VDWLQQSAQTETVDNDMLDVEAKPRSMWRNIAPAIIIISAYIAFVFDFDLGWTTVAAAMLVICSERRDPSVLWSKVNWGLLLFLIGLFVLIEAMNTTPLPGMFWAVLHPFFAQSPGGLFVGTVAFMALILGVTLVFTSIPTVLLVSPHLPVPGPLTNASWPLLAWCVTLAGNLTMFSSVAGLIVAEALDNEYKGGAKSAHIGFWEWFRYSMPSTAFIMALGAAIVVAESQIEA
jgi:Na+/H+ antiporter NhaD/arsenite permease-like protein